MLHLNRQRAKLTNWNPKPELHGKDPQPAGTLTFEFNAASEDVLPMLDPMLRGFLFHKNGTKQHDLADAASHAPDLRFPKMPGPFEWTANLPAATVTVHTDDRTDTDIVLPSAIKKPLTLFPQQGGTVLVTVKAHCHPDIPQAGTLCHLAGHDVWVSLDPGDEAQDDLLVGSDDDDDDEH